MKENDATEQAFRNGYQAGYKAGRRSMAAAHGEWVLDADGGTHCSACGKTTRDVTYGTSIPCDMSNLPFCPKCGAKMDLKEGENAGAD